MEITTSFDRSKAIVVHTGSPAQRDSVVADKPSQADEPSSNDPDCDARLVLNLSLGAVVPPGQMTGPALVGKDLDVELDADNHLEIFDAAALGQPDADGDGRPAVQDNCPQDANATQDDADRDGTGDACDAFPANPSETQDSDGDGMGDNFENTHGLYPQDPGDASSDLDNDGRSALQEFLDGTDPNVAELPVPIFPY